MSNLKRKDAPGGHPPAKSAKQSKEANPSKTDKPKSKPADATTKAVVSRLKDEEPLFPRGGASVLTPLEQKQIQLEAKADAAREEEFSTGGKPQKKKKRATALKKSDKTESKSEDDPVKIESLNFKKLVTGSIVLGQITRINSLALEVALPNNLTGHVSIVAISEQLTKRLQGDAQDEEDDKKDGDSDEEGEDVDLKSLFEVGQFVRAYVVSTVEGAAVSGKGKRKIELSLRPTEANTGLTKDDVVPQCTVAAAVISVEDHGCIMDLGIDGLSGFLPNAEIDATFNRQRIQEGAVFLSQVTAKKGSGKVAQLTLKRDKIGNVNNHPADATTINTFLPGTAVTVLVTGNSSRGVTGKIMGHVDATADLIHSGIGPFGTDVEAKYKIGSKLKARIICNFPTAKDPKLGITLLPHLTALTKKRPEGPKRSSLPLQVLPIASTIEQCTVRHVEADMGLFVDLGVAGLCGYVHISRVKDGKVDALYESSGPYKVGSTHKGRVVGYNEMDGVFHISFQRSVLEQTYIRHEDVPVGTVLTCDIEKLVINEDGVNGLVLTIANGITGFVPERHLSDIKLQHPEKKFRQGMKIKARVLSNNLVKKAIRLTLKKTLVNSETPIIAKYDDVKVGSQALGTIIKLERNGARIQFYGELRGFLPISEMSEAYIRDPSEHFRVGQVVSVHVLDVDPEQKRLVVSCKDPGAFGLEKQTALKNLSLGDIVSAKVTQKSEDQVFVELEGSLLKAILPVSHLTDKSASKNQFALKKVSAGQTLSNLVVIDKNDSRRSIILTQKPSLVKAAAAGKLLKSFEQAKTGKVFAGFVRNITPTAVFVQFAGSLHALLPKARLAPEAQSQPDFGLHKNDSIEVRVVSTIPELTRIMVAPSSAPADQDVSGKSEAAKAVPADGLAFGSITKAKITSVKETQLNVQIVGSEVQGRIDVSNVFGRWDDIADPKHPLAPFHKGQVLRVKVIGVHDAKDHRFLPISHRSAHSILELTTRRSDLDATTPNELTFDSLKVGQTHIAFVNNIAQQHLWVNLSPSIRGRISAMEASDDVSQLNDLGGNFPPGSALKARITSINTENNHLDLSARSASSKDIVTWDSIKVNMVLPGKITKVNERQILVKLSESVSGPVHLPDMADNFDEVNTTQYRKGAIVRVAVVGVDKSNKRLRLSTRPSRIMSSTLPVKDKEISDIAELSAGNIVRGFVKNVADKGLFVLLGGQVSALVKISNLSDRYLKEWKDQFQVDQVVKGRIISIDNATKQMELSLKSSVVDEDYTPPIMYKDISVGQVVTGKVRKVEEFGAFILVDNSANVSGLCHRSQMAENPVGDATKLYKEGDVVKAKVLEVDVGKRRISFGLKPSLFEDEDTDMDSGSEQGAALDDDSDDELDQGALLKLIQAQADDNEDDDEDESEDDGDDDDEADDDEDSEMEDAPSGAGLGGGKSAWTADPFAESGSESEGEEPIKKADKTKKRKKNEIEVDKTAELDTNGPQTSSDYERLLLGQLDSSELWIAYMAFQMQVSELPKAREVAERAIRTINIREETEKLNVWVAYLNLEVAYGTKATVEEVFKRACQYNDPQEVHERLASIYIQSDKAKEAEVLFEAMVKKFGAKAPSVWTNYAHFLHATRGEPERARALLPRATQQLGSARTATVMSRFAALEFHSAHGEPERGRTMFAGLLDTWPKKGDLWNQLLDLEMGVVEGGSGGGDRTAVRDVFERRTRVRGLKPQQAEKWFRRWTAFEEAADPKGGKAKVTAKAHEWAAAFKARKEAAAAAAAEDEEMEE
ncbi:Nucleic acid-binding, OB-fold-like protein [Cordyceps fumosorosea ARSEF 2679]|uniref:rRNA biogenesis protein RRP5 n=1 Tax=Cordyceps fumosorosea (strain ARSEF 2679) TaxID=1081104 RepID=A0A162LJR2_CORFA|nr:Nucleic acid-binding, OB-fold-like protein [Cordyceps fumosorosea ARSEF 2679]OAA71534.1 Nucleic acid-binding, OB-fold-like protein [Cordyceps fumosorosea ARSEF 2679]